MCKLFIFFQVPFNSFSRLLRLALSLPHSYPLRVYSYTESGLFVALLQNFRLNAFLIFNINNRIYSTITEFIDDNTKFDNLSFGNFKMVFEFFFSLCLVLLFVFVVHLLSSKTLQFVRKLILSLKPPNFWPQISTF